MPRAVQPFSTATRTWNSATGRSKSGASVQLCDGMMALAYVVGAVCGDVGDLPIRRDLAQQLKQIGRIPNVSAGDLDCPDLRCLLVDPEVDPVQDAALRVPCVRAFHSPSTSALIPVLSIK